MLRRLAALTHAVPAAGPRALAIAVYGTDNRELSAVRDGTLEGVACVDDAARAIGLLCRLWSATGNSALRAWAEGLLDFVAWMYEGEGRWINFIYDWEGRRNTSGVTSAPGTNFWQARAMDALVDATLLLKSPVADQLLPSVIHAAARSAAPPDVRAIHALAAIRLLRTHADSWLDARLAEWCDEMIECRIGGVLMNSPDERGQPHLWGHVQEAALVQAATMWDRADLRNVAATSAEESLVPAITSAFDLKRVLPYDVQSAAFVMQSLAEETGWSRYSALAREARSWFDGRNRAQASIYDRATGKVADGIDEGQVNTQSGAEANIAGGLALVSDPGVLALAKQFPGPLALGPQPLPDVRAPEPRIA